MKIYFIRHCSTKANKNQVWQGISDVEPGWNCIKELDLLKKTIKDIKFDLIFCSPLIRAVKTAQVCINEDTKILFSDQIKERSFGRLELTPIKEADKIALTDWELNTDLNMGVEKIQSMYFDRVKPFLIDLKNKYEGTNKTIAIVSHSWVGRLIGYFASNEADRDYIEMRPDNAKVYEFDI